MNGSISSVIGVLLIICFLGTSLVMITPIEDADAWPYHSCCDWDYEWFINGNLLEVYWNCEPHYHLHFWSCGFVCP